MKKFILTVIAVLLNICTPLYGADKYVDTANGNDRASGDKSSPWRSIALSLRRVKPGDTVYVLPADAPIAMNIDIVNIFGTSEKPLTLDGMNNLFIGVRPLKAEEWQQTAPGLFRKKLRTSPAMIWRYFMVFDGKINRMGRFTKARGAAAFRDPASLAPGEWTITDPEPENHKTHEFVCFVKLPENSSPEDLCRWSEPFICDGGVQMRERNAHIRVRNIIVKYFWNDGFNIHGDARNIIFENIAAIGCGDDGVSAHETADVTFRNVVSIGNSTGFGHVNKKSVHENFYLSGNLGCDIFMMSRTEMILKNIFVFGDSAEGFKISGQRGNVDISNLLYVKRNSGAGFQIAPLPGTGISFTDCQISGFSTSPADGITLAEKEILTEKINLFREKLFSGFGGRLEKALE